MKVVPNLQINVSAGYVLHGIMVSIVLELLRKIYTNIALRKM